jgi:hypothetical protein
VVFYLTLATAGMLTYRIAEIILQLPDFEVTRIVFRSIKKLFKLLADVSLAVPLTNSLTFAFTTLSGRLLGEPPLSGGTDNNLFNYFFNLKISNS